REARRGVRVLTAGAPPAATTIERIEGELGWVITQAYGLTETSPFITICESRPEHEKLLCTERSVIKARQGVELLTSGELRVVDEEGHDIPQNGEAIGEIIVRGNAVMKGYYKDAEATGEAMRGGWFHRRRSRTKIIWRAGLWARAIYSSFRRGNPGLYSLFSLTNKGELYAKSTQ